MRRDEFYKILIDYRKSLPEEIEISIKAQEELSKKAKEAAKIRWDLEDKSEKLILEGGRKLQQRYPGLIARLNTSEIKAEAMMQMINEADKQTPLYLEIIHRQEEIPEFVENSKLLNELSDVTYNYFNSLIQLNNQIDADREKFFSPYYMREMDKLADEGLLLYFLETPDIPLGIEGIDKKCISNYLLDDNLKSLVFILFNYLNCEYASELKKRKANELKEVLELLLNGCYNSAARTMFALLDNDHKRCAKTFNGYWEKAKEYKNGKQRADKIDNLVSRVNVSWYKHVWDKVNVMWEKITSNEKVEGFIHRNTIIHGDYEKDYSIASRYDVVELILLWKNMDMVADYLNNIEDLYDNILTMMPNLLDDFSKLNISETKL